MPLRSRLESSPETLGDFELAAEERYWEGMELLLVPRNAMGIYLLGYSAEMLLKSAFFRLDGATPRDVVKPRLKSAKTNQLIPAESYHSLLFWLAVIRESRIRQSKPLDAAFDRLAGRRISGIYDEWWIEMRYRPDSAQLNEAGMILEDVTWLRDNYLIFWS